MKSRFFNADFRELFFESLGWPKVGTNAAGEGIKALAWQLRSNSLELVNGHVVILGSMVASEWNQKTKTREVVQARVDAINAIIDAEQLTPVDIEELITYFDKLAYPENEK